MVEYVRRIRTDLKIYPLPDGEGLTEREVDVLQTRSVQAVPAIVPISSWSRLSVRRHVVPRAQTPSAWHAQRIPDNIWKLRVIAGKIVGIIVAAGCDGERIAAL